MRGRHILLAVCVFALTTCKDSTAPDGATITFEADPITCAGGANVQITIDGEDQGFYSVPAGGSWSFVVDPGTHTVKVAGEGEGGGFAFLEREVTVSEAEDFVVPFTCTG